MKINRFEELQIWKLSLKITKDIYDITSKKEFDFSYQELEVLSKQIGGFIVYLETKRKEKQFMKK